METMLTATAPMATMATTTKNYSDLKVEPTTTTMTLLRRRHDILRDRRC
jgi:hypothetical protein